MNFRESKNVDAENVISVFYYLYPNMASTPVLYFLFTQSWTSGVGTIMNEI